MKCPEARVHILCSVDVWFIIKNDFSHHFDFSALKKEWVEV